MATTALTSSATLPGDGGPRQIADDAARPSTGMESNFRCPDPSVHVHGSKTSVLQNQASAAALYSTGSNKTGPTQTINPLGADGKLSSASAATSLKYAKATDLPSFPVVGIDTKSSAGAAALLANQNKKSPEWWKPEQSAAAGKAALLANDFKMAPLWQPEASAAGSKAALLAARDGAKLNLWQPEASTAGNSAANIAMRKQGLGPGAVDYGYTDEGKRNAFTAATGAHSSAGRQRAQSNPAPVPAYPDAKNSAKNALSAATLAHSPSLKAKPQTTPGSDSNRQGYGAMEAARIQHAKSISKEMWTSAPPVAPEIEEKKRNDALRASAISMAKKMYDVQQNHIEGATTARTGATAAQGRGTTTGEEDIKQQAMRYVGIQEAAQKLAQERLAKIGFDENAAYRSYYGYEKPKSKLSLRGRRNRASSASEPAAGEASDSDEDDLRTRRIRSQMDQFNKQLAEVDAKKRENDRKHLLAVAERKVQAQLQGMDKSVYDKTGKMSAAMIEQWDEKARQKATANSEARMENHGKIHIGNGKWMDQSDIDAIAQARIQPTLDEIAEKTEKRRAEDEKRRAEEEERRLDVEEKKRREKIEKERVAEIKAEEKEAKEKEKRALKQQNAEAKAILKQEKEAAKQEGRAEKAKKAEEERLARDEKRKSKEAPAAAPVVAGTAAAVTSAENDDLYHDPSSAAQQAPSTEAEPKSPTSPNSKGIKSMLSKLKRRSKQPPAESSNTSDVAKDSKSAAESGFIGGAALRTSTTSQPNSATSDGRPHDLGDVEPAVVPHLDEVEAAQTRAEAPTEPRSRASSVSSFEEIEPPRGRAAERVTSATTAVSGASEFEEARDHFDQDLAPPPTFTSEAEKASPARDSKFKEVGI